MTNVYATQAIAEAHVAELHRVAAQRRALAQYRRARGPARPSPIGTLAVRKVWAAATAWSARTRAVKASAGPACCPA